MSKDGVSFEAKLNRLEQIVKIMERGEAPLDDALKLFQEGTELARECGAMLDNAELQVKMIVPDVNGEPSEEEFDHE